MDYYRTILGGLTGYRTNGLTDYYRTILGGLSCYRTISDIWTIIKVQDDQEYHITDCTDEDRLKTYEQWFSNDRMSGKSDALNAVSAMASNTSCTLSQSLIIIIIISSSSSSTGDL